MKSGGTGGATNPNVYDTSAAAYNAAVRGTKAGYNVASNVVAGANDVSKAYDNYDPNQGVTGYTPSNLSTPKSIAAGMSKYFNPYENSVVKRAAGDVQRSVDQNLNAIGADAAAAGAFGGSRHGLVEAETRRNGIDTIADTAAQLRAAGFDTRAQLANQDISNRITVGSANQSANLAAAQLRSNELSNAADRGLAAIGGQLSSLNTALAGGNQMLSAAQQGGNLAGQGVEIGNGIQQQQAQYGALQQGLMQLLMTDAKDMFDSKTSQPKEALALLASAISGSPLNAATTTTSTSKPGLLDYLSLAGQTGAALFGSKK